MLWLQLEQKDFAGTAGGLEKNNHPIPTEHSERPSAPAPVVQPGVAVAGALPAGVGHVLDLRLRLIGHWTHFL